MTTTVTKSLPTAKDRVSAIAALGRYAGMEPGKGEGSTDVQVMVRALVSALREPGVLATLMADEDTRNTLRLLAAEEVAAEEVP